MKKKGIITRINIQKPNSTRMLFGVLCLIFFISISVQIYIENNTLFKVSKNTVIKENTPVQNSENFIQNIYIKEATVTSGLTLNVSNKKVVVRNNNLNYKTMVLSFIEIQFIVIRPPPIFDFSIHIT